MFQNDTCSNTLNMKYIAKQYYQKKSQGFETGLHSTFVYMDYPWLFSTEAKVEVIQNEASVAMQNHLVDVINEMEGEFLFGGNLEDAVSLNIQVRRDKILEDSLRMLSTQSKNYKKQLKIKFAGEQGVDQGGVKKEFFHLLMKELFNPDYAMFEHKLNVRSFQLGPLSVVQQAVSRVQRKFRVNRYTLGARYLQLSPSARTVSKGNLQKAGQRTSVFRRKPSSRRT